MSILAENTNAGMNFDIRPSITLQGMTLPFASIVVLMALVLSSCNDQPTELGGDFATDTANAYALTSEDTALLAGADNAVIPGFAGENRPLFNAGLLYIGKAGDVEGHTILRFTTIPDTLGLERSEDYSIQQAVLTIHPRTYAFGNTGSNLLTFNIHEMLHPWDPGTTLDTLDSLQEAGAQLYSNEVFGEFRGVVPLVDSAPSVRIRLENVDFLSRWFERQVEIRNCKLQAEDAEDSAQCDNNFGVYGLALLPGDDATVVRQFATQAVGDLDLGLSTIEVLYQHKDSVGIDTVIIEAGFDGTFIRAPEAEDGTLTLQGGAALRSHMYFDVSMIPDLSFIHKAELKLTLDPERSVLGHDINEFDPISFTFAEDSTFSITVRERFTATHNTETNVYTFPDLGVWVERWMLEGDNFGLVLHIQETDEFNKLNRLVFYGLDAPLDKRPRLRILYRTRPK